MLPARVAVLAGVEHLGPDVIVLDERLPDTTGSHARHEIRRRRPSTSVRHLYHPASIETIRRPVADTVLIARELETLRLAAQGRTNEAIAKAIDVSLSTVKSDLRHAIEKLNARDKAHAVAEAIRRGLVDTDLTASIASIRADASGTGANRHHMPARSRRSLPPHLYRILIALAEGLRASDIAARFGLSVHTVKTYLREVYAALGTTTRAQTVATAMHSGLL
jgi:DNA-binding NarL/FixJ family response regulator